MNGDAGAMRETVLGDIDVAISELSKIVMEQKGKLDSAQSFFCGSITKLQDKDQKEQAHNGFLAHTLWRLKGIKSLLEENGDAIQKIHSISRSMEKPIS